MAKTAFSLSAVLAFATKHGLDVTDLQACKEAYKLDKEGKEAKEEKRAYTRRQVSVFVTLPNGKVYKLPELYNNESALILAAAFKFARSKLKDDAEGMKQVTVTWAEESSLMDLITSTNV